MNHTEETTLRPPREPKTLKERLTFFYGRPKFLAKTNGWLVVALTMAVATIVSAGFFLMMENPSANIALTYVLAVFLVARSTDSYRYGLVASVMGVIFVNYLYTYPYGQINFGMTGYPITFIAMFTISGITSAMITNMKEQAQALQQQEKELMEAEKEKMRANLLRAISHDLRTPLTSIIGSGTIYLENGSDMSEEEKSELVRHILEDSNWLLNMVENLLSVTRINNETARVKKTEEPVEEVVGEAVARLRKRIPEARISVTVPDEFIMIPMDAILIEQVLINLMENAVVHSGTEEPVECSTRIREDAVEFHIRDYGIGIPEERMDSLFDGSTRTAARTSDGKKGMGIGLTICKTIVTAHGGQIFARNRDPGAEFWFELPRENRDGKEQQDSKRIIKTEKQGESHDA